VSWAALEALLMIVLGESLLGLREDKASVTFWHMGFNDKRDRLVSLVQLLETLTPIQKQQFDSLMTRLNAASSLRNIIVHSVWGKSTRPNAITPHVMRARGGRIKRSGINLPEEHFTPERLHEEARKIEQLGRDFRKFAIAYLNYKPETPES
jgi:hypothetical protein